MTPTKFPQATRDLIAPQGHVPSDEVGVIITLPVWSSDEQCISCWRMTWRERIAAVVFGKVWLAVATRSHTQPPVQLTVTRSLWPRPRKSWRARRHYLSDGYETTPAEPDVDRQTDAIVSVVCIVGVIVVVVYSLLRFTILR